MLALLIHWTTLIHMSTQKVYGLQAVSHRLFVSHCRTITSRMLHQCRPKVAHRPAVLLNTISATNANQRKNHSFIP